MHLASLSPLRSALRELEGSASGRRYPADRLATVDPADGRPLLARYDLADAARTLTAAALAGRQGGLWRWWELLPVQDIAAAVHLGEGGTALLAAPRLGATLGVRRLMVKAESLNPTGSFKARGMAVAVSRAVELGATSLVAPSAGNAAGALAAYGAAAGAAVTVLMPADAPAVNHHEAAACGATVLLVDGLIDDCGRIARLLAERAGAFDVSTLREPYRVEGKKTMGLELAEQSSWRLPDVVVYPTGGGTGLVGMWKAFDELVALGLTGEERPRMVAVQAEGCAPIVRAFEAGASTAERWEGAVTRAGGIRVPAAIGDMLILDALRASGGTAVAVPEDGIDEGQRLAGRLGLGYVSPETGAAVAAVRLLRGRGDVGGDERVVVFDTGAGHKYPPPPGLPRPPVLAADAGPEELDAALSTGR
jgi:threonine synthase